MNENENKNLNLNKNVNENGSIGRQRHTTSIRRMIYLTFKVDKAANKLGSNANSNGISNGRHLLLLLSIFTKMPGQQRIDGL